MKNCTLVILSGILISTIIFLIALPILSIIFLARFGKLKLDSIKAQ